MEIEDISKVFLISYKDIPRMIKSLDRCIDHAVMSGFGCSHIYNGLTTDMLYEKIIVFKNRQDILATVRDLTKKILTKMTKNYSKILILKYIYGYSFGQIATKFDISERSVYRYIKKAISEFCYYLKVYGYSSDEWLKGELFLEGIYDNLLQTEQKEQNYLNKKMLKERAKDRIKNLQLNANITTNNNSVVYIEN